MKKCPKCKEEKEDKKFRKGHTWCKECTIRCNEIDRKKKEEFCERFGFNIKKGN